MIAVHQFLPNLTAADAIGNHTLRMRDVLRAAGFRSSIFAEVIDPVLRHEARPYLEFDQRGGDDGPCWLLYQLSTGSPMARWLQQRPEPLIVDYHNITEARFFDRWAPGAADNMRRAREEMRMLAPRTRLALAVSEFNAAELRDADYGEVAVAPLLMDFSEFDEIPDSRTMARLARQREQGGGARWLFVGRLAPNKCQHDVIAAFAVYRRLFDPAATLTLVGGVTVHLYRRALETLAAELGVTGAVEFTDRIAGPELVARYRAADVFVCLSEHEGVGAPVLEAMHLDVPVVAYAAAALPETVADAGILLPDKDPALVAEAVHRVLSDAPMRARLLEAGHERVAHFATERTAKVRTEILTRVVEGAKNGG